MSIEEKIQVALKQIEMGQTLIAAGQRKLQSIAAPIDARVSNKLKNIQAEMIASRERTIQRKRLKTRI
jgi:hypothetical protein